MNYRSHADLGGRELRERVVPEPEGDPFHARWEQRAHAITIAMGATGLWNIDMSRAARETLADYGTLDYYGKWLAGLERLLCEHGIVGADEIAAGRALRPGCVLPRVLAARDVASTLARGAPTARVPATSARFAIGARVRTRPDAAPHHTRLPGYARGKSGRIERVLGAHVFADTHAQGLGEQPQWLYTVVVSGEELWGAGAERERLEVSIDAWEPYLESG